MINKRTAALYFHTIRHLRARQIINRAWRRIRISRAPEGSALPLRRPVSGFCRPVVKPQSLREENRFVFLNRTGHISRPGDWNNPGMSRLWLYNAHYFDDLVAADAELRRVWHRRLMDRWIEDNPVGDGCGWEPYPLSLRIVNWIKCHLTGFMLTDRQLASLAQQTRYLRANLEYHLLGNHLIANAKALVFAGCFFDGAEAASWRILGRRILERELKEQVLADGGHIERSPMYHAIELEDILDTIGILSSYGDQRGEPFKVAARSMLDWLARMTHPDGEISFFNDAAFSIAPNFEELSSYAKRLSIPVPDSSEEFICLMEESGYARLRSGGFTLIADVAPLGPDYLPGHAHADMLAFECSLGNERLLVNSGTSTYESGSLRQWQRSTSAHNTVCVDAEDSSEMWGAFRVARRGRSFDLQVNRDTGCLSARHDGYRRLKGRVTHSRRWVLTKRGFRVEDSLRGGYSSAVGHFYLHPEVRASVDAGGVSGTLQPPSQEIVRWQARGGTVRVRGSRYYPEFGTSIDNLCLELHFEADQATMEFMID